jgi:hypothetical protein
MTTQNTFNSDTHIVTIWNIYVRVAVRKRVFNNFQTEKHGWYDIEKFLEMIDLR